MSETDAAVAENTESTTEESGSLLNPGAAEKEELNPEESAISHMADEQADIVAQEDEEIDWGERPDYIPEQFWSDTDGPDLEGMAKAYNEMRTKMSQGKHKAPKDGKYDIAQLKEQGVADDDPLLSQFTNFATENGLSQDQFDQITAMYAAQMADMTENIEYDRQQEMQKLGPKADKIISGLDSWLSKLGNSGTLSPEEVDAVASAANNANYIKALNKIRASYGEQTIPDVSVQEGTNYTKADLDAMIADPRYGKDMAYTQGVERKFMEFFGEA